MVCARQPAEVMAWLVARKFDVYVVDATVPGESAVGICRTIRTIDKDGAVICVAQEDTNREKVLNAGADLFLKLPENVGQIRRTVDDLLDSPKSDSVH